MKFQKKVSVSSINFVASESEYKVLSIKRPICNDLHFLYRHRKFPNILQLNGKPNKKQNHITKPVPVQDSLSDIALPITYKNFDIKL